jgi:hypothetical protein
MPEFSFQDPSLETQWRAILLFGRNVASYKFALASALLDLGAAPDSLIRLEDLAGPFAQHICRHLKEADKQATSSSSRFLDACRAHNRGELPLDKLKETTVQLGFQNVIDAFHMVGRADVLNRFFMDERRESGGIRITDDFYKLTETNQAGNLKHEGESRWRLVETAWDLNLPAHVLHVVHDPVTESIITAPGFRRRSITGTRPALNGYQKGQCFYCYGEIDLDAKDGTRVDVDHFLPHFLAKDFPFRLGAMIDGVWNLVLSCADCNRGRSGKFDALPAPRLLDRLHTRNEFLISSHHPLRETLILQTGDSSDARAGFLKGAYSEARNLRPTAPWHPIEVSPPLF